MIQKIVVAIVLIWMASVHSASAQTDTLSQQAYNEAVEHYNLGTDLFYEKNYREALPLLRHATKLNPYNSDYWFALSSTQNALAMLDSALHSITESIKMEPRQSDYLLHRANVYFKLKKYMLAIGDYGEALKYQEESEIPVNEGHVYFNRGNCWMHLKDFARAKADFDEAIEFGYELANVYHNRATARIRLNDRSGACRDYRKAVELGSKISGEYVDKYCQ